MNLAVIIFLASLLGYALLTAPLLYVWWKYGKGEKGVRLATLSFLTGSFVLLAYMITL